WVGHAPRLLRPFRGRLHGQCEPELHLRSEYRDGDPASGHRDQRLPRHAIAPAHRGQHWVGRGTLPSVALFLLPYMDLAGCTLGTPPSGRVTVTYKTPYIKGLRCCTASVTPCMPTYPAEIGDDRPCTAQPASRTATLGGWEHGVLPLPRP